MRRGWKHIAYRHIERGFNAVPDDMARRALAIRADVIFMPGPVPSDAPQQQVSHIYENVKNLQAVLLEPEEYYGSDWSDILSRLELGESV